jgi:DNA-binding MarR family transcriptional regulator
MTKTARTSYLIRRVQLLVYTNLTECLRADDLTPIQYMMLSLSRRGGEMSSADLARRFSIAPQSVNEMIAALQRKKLIARRPTRENRRILRISLTSEGRQVLHKCDRQVDRMEKRLFAPLSQAELTALRAGLEILIHSEGCNHQPGSRAALQKFGVRSSANAAAPRGRERADERRIDERTD